MKQITATLEYNYYHYKSMLKKTIQRISKFSSNLSFILKTSE